MTPRSSGAQPRSALIAGACCAAALAAGVLVATDAISIPFTGFRPEATALDETIAARARQIALFAEEAGRFGCGAPTSTDQIAGCAEMQARLAAMERGLVTLKARAGGRWVGGAKVVQTQGFLDNLFGGMLRRGGERSARREEEFFDPRPQRRERRREPRQSQTVQRGGTVRTMCVRECDGYYWPVSFSTTRDRLSKDAETCKSSCNSPAKLYYYDNPGGGVGDMVDLNGKRYADTPNAFRHQVEYVGTCRCTPLPWSKEAKAIYAARAAAETDTASKGRGEGDVKQASARQERKARRKARRNRSRGYADRRNRHRDAYALGWDEGW